MNLAQRATDIATNRDAGASELLSLLLPLLAQALAHSVAATHDVVRTICEGQPAMAPLWNACAAAVADRDAPGRFVRVRAEMERAPAALVRAAGTVLADVIADQAAATILTLSFSHSVAQTLAHVARHRSLHVVCGEGRPRFEGRRMASLLARSGCRVTLTTDAALAVFLHEATAVVVGADAIAADRWINKVGTLGVVAAADRAGVPVFVVSARDKALAQALASRWLRPRASGDEVWDAPTAGVAVANPYFESIPADLATLFLTDAGPVPVNDLSSISERYSTEIARLLTAL